MTKKTETLGQLESLRPALAELERAAMWLAERRLDIINHKVLVTVQTKGKKASCTGWFAKSQWSTREGEPVHEINISAESLNRAPEEIVETMAHELCHLQNEFAGVKDVAKGGRHNKNFKETAEIMGLVVETPYDAKGHAYTSLGEELKAAIETEFVPDVAMFNLFREVKLKEKAVNKTKAYVCACVDGPVVRTAKKFEATCDICATGFILRN